MHFSVPPGTDGGAGGGGVVRGTKTSNFYICG